jgi:hypothetical protein
MLASCLLFDWGTDLKSGTGGADVCTFYIHAINFFQQ